MKQEFKEERFYKHTNRITQIITVLIIFVCMFSMTSLGFTLYSQFALPIGLAFLAVAFLVSGNMVHMCKRDFFYIIFLLAYFLLTLPFTGGGIGSVSAPIMTVLWIQIMRWCKLTKLLVRTITWMFCILFMVSLIRCPNYFAIWTARGGEGMNPNTLAVLIVFSSTFILIFNQNNKIYKKCHLCIPQIFLTFWGILNCGSRASLLTFTVFIMFKYLMPLKMKRSRKVACFIYGSCVIAGLVFPLIYICIYQNTTSLDIPVISTLISGKSFFSGREKIWDKIFVELSKKNYGWLIGIGSKADIRTSGFGINPHNAYMLILMDFGFFGIVAYYSFYLFHIKNIYFNGIFFTEQLDFIYLGLSFFVLSFFETVLLWHPFIIIISFIFGIPQGYNYTSCIKDYSHKL